MPSPRQIRTELAGVTLAALTWGPEDGPLALCLHGFPDTAWTWRHLGPELAQDGWRVVAPFLRGYGPSSLADDGNYQVGALIRDVVQLHTALGADGDAVLIGHDWGAAIAYGVAAFDPTLFRRVVTLSVPPLPALWRAGLRTLLRQLPHSWYVLVALTPGLGERVLAATAGRLWTSWSPGLDAPEDVARLRAALAEPGCWTAALRYYRAFAFPWMRTAAYRAEQRSVFGVPSVPTLSLHGARDGCMVAGLARATGDLLPAGSLALTLAEVGHFLHLERPDLVDATITSFVRAEVPQAR